MRGHAGGCVRRPGNGHVLPGQEEDDPTITGCWVQKTHVVRAGGDQEQKEVFKILKNKEESQK